MLTGPDHATPRTIAGYVLAFAAALLLGTATPASAWNKAGHMLTAAMAADIMDAADVAKVVEILRGHPEFAAIRGSARAAAGTSSGPDHAKAVLMYAARWPDDARDNPTYHRETWHFINHPIVAGQGVTPPSTVQPVDNIARAFERNWSDARGADRHRRAIAVAWLTHLTGDAHQPLHSAALFSPRYPKGDRGGNLFFVRTAKNGNPVKLHSLWDGLVIGVDPFEAVAEKARSLESAYRRDALVERRTAGPQSPEAIARWIDESLDLARTAAYRYRDIALKGATSAAADPPVLPAGYVRDATGIAERRVALAAYRLADLLTALVR